MMRIIISADKWFKINEIYNVDNQGNTEMIANTNICNSQQVKNSLNTHDESTKTK